MVTTAPSPASTLRTSLALIWVILILFTLALYVVMHVFVIRSFVQLEDHATRRNVYRMVDAIGERAMSIDAHASDWAAWDDAYEFMQNGSHRFIHSNFALSAFAGNNLNLIAYIHNSGQIAYGRWYRRGDPQLSPIPADVRAAITQRRLLTHSGPRDSTSGIIMLRRGPMLIASRPVVTSNEKGPVRGTLVFGRLLDSAELHALSGITHMPIVAVRLDRRPLPGEFARARREISESGSIVVRPVSRHATSGYTIVKDVFGRPALMLRTRMPRAIYNRGLAVIDYALGALAVLSVLVGSTASFLLARTVAQEHEYDAKTREFYRSTIEIATGGKLAICQQGCVPTWGRQLGKWDVAQPEDVPRVRCEVCKIAEREGLEEPLLTDFTLCVGESITNAVKHGGGGYAILRRTDESLLFIVCDQGPGIEALAIPELALKSRYSTVASMGVGYKVLLSLADKVYLATGPAGTTVAIEKRFKSERGEEEYWIPETWNA